jgi:phenylpropionate dioxygenase-like ring-hydroxylating dioxygenase large terminal subunit
MRTKGEPANDEEDQMTTEARLQPGQARSPRESVRDLLAREVRPVPAFLEEDRYEFLGSEDLPKERYYSREFHDLEVARMWRKVWQWACLEQDIPSVGDTLVYEIADASIIVARVAPDLIKAYANSCLHRGTQLCSGPGHLAQIRCPYHGLTWNLDGSLKEIPASWDFEHIDQGSFCLPEYRVATWQGFVFVNLDQNPAPFNEYIDVLPDHLNRYNFVDRWKFAHVAKIEPCNWKVALEAFIESFHVTATHPQLASATGNAETKTDVYGRHVNRMIIPNGVVGSFVKRPMTEQEIADAIVRHRSESPTAAQQIRIPEGATARQVWADQARAELADQWGMDLSMLTDCEAIDGIGYFLFPNFLPWAGYRLPLFYRFRPNGNDPESCVMETILIGPYPKDGTRPPAAPIRWLEPEQKWSDAQELGRLGPILDQDASNFGRVQRGLRASVKPGVTLANYQEVRIRHFHKTLMEYLATP